MVKNECLTFSFAGTTSSFVVCFIKLMHGNAAALLLKAGKDKETETESDLLFNDLMKDNKTMGSSWMMKLGKNCCLLWLFVLLPKWLRGGRILVSAFSSQVI